MMPASDDVFPLNDVMTTSSFVQTTETHLQDPYVSALAVDRPPGQVGVEILFLTLMCFLSVTGNCFVCVVINRSRRIQSTTNYFVVSLACADIVLAILCMPFIASRVIGNRWLLGSPVCKFVRFVQVLVPSVNFYVLVSIAIDRYYTIIYPLSFKVTKSTARKMITASWLSAVTLSGFCFYFFDIVSNVDGSGRTVCRTYVPSSSWSGIMYTIFVFCCETVIPTVLLLVCYIGIFKHVWRVSLGPRPVHRTMNPVPRTKVKVVKMLIVVTLTFLCLNVPFSVTQLLNCLTNSLSSDPSLYITCTWLVCSTGVCKPLVYLYFNSNFRRGCKEVICVSTSRCYRHSTYAITNASSFGKRNHIGVMETSVLEPPSLDSPSKIFNRSLMVEKSAWPLPPVTSSTYI